MKGKLYIFGIGGTGSRVIKSLVMLSAAGANLNVETIVPIVIDPDFANADLTRTIELIKSYSAIRSQLSFTSTQNKFFETKIENVVNDYRLAIRDTKNKKFSEFIEYSTLSKQNKALASILFSNNNLEADMEVGFKGNPNVGSVVLNQFTDSEDFIKFTEAFHTGDRIFIISSIFGGTGASGFPLLVKNIRNLDSGMPNSLAIKNAPIGAITVLPYFDVKLEKYSSINSSTFVGKTKAALKYYEKNVSGEESSVNALYYIGDEKKKQYDNNEGGTDQQNHAHFIELAGALSIIDFASINDDDPILSCKSNDNGKFYAPSATYREFGLDTDENNLIFANLSQPTRDIVCKPLTSFVLFSKFIKEEYSRSFRQPWAKDNAITDSFAISTFSNNIKKFADRYITWLYEMGVNERGFSPFKLDVRNSELYSIIYGVKPNSIKSLWAFNKSGYDLFNAALNETHTSVAKNLSEEEKFIEMFYQVTQLLVEKKYKF